MSLVCAKSKDAANADMPVTTRARARQEFQAAWDWESCLALMENRPCMPDKMYTGKFVFQR
eukprot:8218713-Alexandrium_andersonii.AAC.1